MVGGIHPVKVQWFPLQQVNLWRKMHFKTGMLENQTEILKKIVVRSEQEVLGKYK